MIEVAARFAMFYFGIWINESKLDILMMFLLDESTNYGFESARRLFSPDDAHVRDFVFSVGHFEFLN